MKRIGVDVGGTFTDLILVDEEAGRITVDKVPSTPDDPSRGVVDGITRLENPYPRSEFIRSSDPNFRIVNMVNGPDGCLYLVDMYRGIIQEGNWVREGSYLRKVVQQYSLDKVAGHGRVWRLVHKDFQPGPQPRMLEETPAQWVAHLSHPNGWWRDTAQKLLVLKGDKSVVPALHELALRGAEPLGRIHALWTLEGLGALDAATVRALLASPDARLRAKGLRAGETLVKAGDKGLVEDFRKLGADREPTVDLRTSNATFVSFVLDSRTPDFHDNQLPSWGQFGVSGVYSDVPNGPSDNAGGGAPERMGQRGGVCGD